MKTVLKFEEWQNASGTWCCGGLKWLGQLPNQWYYAPRRLGISLTDYIEMLKNKYNAKVIFSNDVLIFYWAKQSEMRLFKNWINKQFRDKKVYVD